MMKKLILCLFILYTHSLFSQCFPDRHSTNWFDGWVSCKEKLNPNPANGAGHWIMYDLKNQYLIDKIKFWNVNDPDHLNWGMKNIRIEYSIDSLVWSSAGEFILDKAEGTNRYEGMNWMDVQIPKARYILITALSNFGGTCFGLAELQFSAEKIEIVTDVENKTDVTDLQINILPNPFTDIFRAEFKGTKNSNLAIEIIDLFGKTLYTENLNLDNGYNTLRIQTKKWPSGAYILSAKQDSKIQRVQLIKI
jgi:hypothetical protein